MTSPRVVPRCPDGHDAGAPRVAVIGEALIDLVPAQGEQAFRALPGGSPFNVAIGLSRLGVPTALMARLTTTPFGQLLRSRARSAGVDLSFAPHASETTTLAVVSFDRHACANYDFYVRGTADWQWTSAELARTPEAIEVLHFGSLASWMPPGRERILVHVRRRRREARMLITYDPNVRPGLIGDARIAREAVEQCVRLADLVKASAEDVEWLYDGQAVDEVVNHWLTLGPVMVVITDGPKGARAHRTDQSPIAVPGLPVELVDTVGAGDSFTAALIASLLDRQIAQPVDLAGCAAREVGEALGDAVIASALTCGRAGAEPPTLSELDAARSLRSARRLPVAER